MSGENLEQLQAMDYPVKISFDPEERIYVADVFDLPGCSVSGDTAEEAYQRAKEAKNEWLRVTFDEGLPIPKPPHGQEYSGRILARVPSTLHGMLSDKAKLHGVSLNQYVVHLLSAGVVGDEVSAQLDQLKAKISELEWQVGQLTTTLKLQPVQGAAFQFSNVAAKTFVTTAFLHDPVSNVFGSLGEVPGQNRILGILGESLTPLSKQGSTEAFATESRLWPELAAFVTSSPERGTRRKQSTRAK